MFSDEKGFATAEFVFVSLIVLIIMGGMISLIGSTQNKAQAGQLGAASILGQKIAETVNTVYIDGNGYSATLDPTTINKEVSSTNNPFNFTANISTASGTGVLTVTTGSNSATISLIPTKFSGITSITNNRTYQVTNVNGTIQIS